MWYKNKPVGGSSEKVNNKYLKTKNVILNIFFFFKTFCIVKKIIYNENQTFSCKFTSAEL
jgi:hypothetical protein